MKEADERVKRYIPVREKVALKGQIIREMCEKEDVGEGELRLGGKARNISRIRSKIAGGLNREYGIPMAEIAQDLGNCTSTTAKSVPRMEGKS